MAKASQVDMIHGPLTKKIWVFTIPIMLSGILQLLFNAADMMIVGRAVNEKALAAIGCTASMSNLIVNLFIGLSIGCSVVVAQLYGGGRKEAVSDMVHTSITVSFVGGIVIGAVGFIASPYLLRLMGTPESILDMAVLYVRIYFCGMPAVGLYNFGAAILRAVGETKRPMIYLLIAGLVNVFLNIIFVVVFKMSVDGVALATTISQTVSAVLTIGYIMRSTDCIKLYLNRLKINMKYLWDIIRIGVPAGVQGSLFAVSNMLIQSAVNSFGEIAVAANTAAANISAFSHIAVSSFSQTAVTFTGQNVGAGRWDRVKRVLGACAASVCISGTIASFLVMFSGKTLLSFYNTNPEVINTGYMRLGWLVVFQVICGIMEMLAGMMRGMGKSIMPTVVALLGACAFRVVWIYTVFAWYKELWVVYASYPVSWTLTALIHFICFIFVYKSNIKRQMTKLN